MIASLKGVIDSLNSTHAIVDVSGVGYKVLLSQNVLSKLKPGEKIKFSIYTHVRDDCLDLFGFLNNNDLSLFENLISVSGVGPKTALSIFSFGSAEEILKAIGTADLEFFQGIPRLGKKNAQKIIIELKNKLGSNAELDLSGQNLLENKEVADALKNFGFTGLEINKVLNEIRGKGETAEEKIKLALKYLGK